MSSQPSLSTRRLVLEPVVPQDLAFLHALWRQPSVRRFLFHDDPVTLATAASLLSECMARSELGLGLWLVRETRTGRILGCAGLGPMAAAADFEPRLSGLYEPVVALDPNHQGLGFATEAVSALLDHALGALAASAIGAVNDHRNIAAAQLLDRLGFEPLSAGRRPEHMWQTYRLEPARWRAADVGGPLRQNDR
jgi:[ribosomal protein S5]-alanine N-acetyltransferase